MEKQKFTEIVFNSSILNRFQSPEYTAAFRAGIEASYDQMLTFDSELLYWVRIFSLQQKMKGFERGDRVIIVSGSDSSKPEKALTDEIFRMQQPFRIVDLKTLSANFSCTVEKEKRKGWEPPYKFHR